MSQPPPPGGPFYPPPPGSGYSGPGPQQPWPNQPPGGQWPPAPPPKRGNGWKWALGVVALLAVIGVTVAVTMSVSDGGDGVGSPPRGATNANGVEHSDIASADDTGPIAVITEDASCAPQVPILNMRAAAQDNGWAQRDPSIPATAWIPEVRAQYEEVGQSMRNSADQLVPIAKMTPNRVMRELYEQLIAYSRAYADSIPTYTAADDKLARVTIGLSDIIANVCSAVRYSSAAARGPLVSPLPAPDQIASVGDPAESERFLTQPDAVCSDWYEALAQFEKDSTAWRAIPSEISASQWTAEQRAVHEAVSPVMLRLANQLQALGERSANPVLHDFAALAAQYRRAYVEALPTYVPADGFLAGVANRAGGVVEAACQAPGS